MATAKGVDTTFLIELEIPTLPTYRAARALLDKLVSDDAVFAVAPQVLMEFIHIVTDSKRFDVPLPMEKALARARYWWQAKEVFQVIPSANVPLLTFEWLIKFSLGRKRILDTQLAATYHSAGISTLISSNERDFRVYDCFKIIVPGETSAEV